MKVLLDENLPHRLRLFLPGHDVFKVSYMNWRGVKNGRLLALAAENGFDAMLTLDDSIAYQTNLQTLAVGVVVLSAPSAAFDDIQPLIPEVISVLTEMTSPCVRRVPTKTGA